MKYNKKLFPRMSVYIISVMTLPVLMLYFPKFIMGGVTG